MYTGTAWYDALTIANEAGMYGNVGIGTASPISPTAKLTIDNVGTDWSFGNNAVYVADPDRYFDFDYGMVFRGTGPYWNARFTGAPGAGDTSEIVGIYKEEVNAGDTRNAVPPQGAIAVFRNNGDVEIADTTFKDGGNVGVGAASPTAKLTVDNVGTDDSFGNNAVYVASTNRYFDFHNGLMFRGEGSIWSARFTSTDYMNPDGEIVGIYKEEINAGDTRENQPSQGPVAVFKNNGKVGIGTNTNLGPSLTIKSAEDLGNYGALEFQSESSDTNYVHFTLDGNNDFIVGTFDGGAWHDSLIIETSSGFLGYGYGMTNPQHLIHLSGGAYSDGSTWVDASSREYKTDITPLALEQAQETLAGLDSVTFRYKADEDGELHVGFIAEDVPELVATADRKGLSPMDIVAVLVPVVQDQQERLAEQEAQIAAQQERIDDLGARVAALERCSEPFGSAQDRPVEGVAAGGTAPAHPLQSGLLPGAGVLLAGLALGLLARRGVVLSHALSWSKGLSQGGE